MSFRARFALASIALSITSILLCAGPALTTIQDLLYKADGTRFNGTLLITWTGFQAGDTSNIATQSVTAPVSNGYLRVVLVPTTTAATPTVYNVVYNSDGKIQYSETWVVPPSNTPLRVADVLSSRTDGDVAAAITQLQISDISGLQTELNIRPTIGAGYAPSRASVIDSVGGLGGATGNLSDCVHVDGTSGPCGSAVAGTDFAPPTSGTSILKGNGSGGFNPALAGTDYQAPLGFTPENLANKGAANGYAGLDAGGKYPWSGLSGIPNTFTTPFPGNSTLGGVLTKDCSAGGQFLQKINSDGTETCATPVGGGGGGGGGVADPGGNGLMVRTAPNTTTARSIAATAPLTIANSDGTLGNPTIAISAASTAAAGSVQLAGDLGGTGASPSVLKINGNVPGGTCTSSVATAIDSSGRPVCSASIAVSGSVSTGSSPPVVASGSGGLAAWIEGTPPTAGLPGAGVDGCYGDAATHGLLCSFNNDSLSKLARASNNLGFFSTTTSVQLAAVLSDETGIGAAVFGTGPAITSPAISGAATMLDMSAATTTNAFKVPVAAGATSTANGGVAYDSTNNMLHVAQSGADAMVPQFTTAPVNNDCAKWVVSGSNYKLGTAGAACGSGGGGGGYSTIQGNGVSAAQRSTVNFAGYNVVVSDVGGSTTQVSIDDPASTMYMKENFTCGNSASGSIGCLGWYLNNTGYYANNLINTVLGSPGIGTLTTSGASGAVVSISPVASDYSINSGETFKIRLKVISVTGTNPSSNIRLRVGLTGNIAADTDPPPNGFYLEKLESDSDWFCVVNNAATVTRADTGVAYVTTATAVQIRRIDTTHIGCKVAATLGGLAAAAEVSNGATESTFDTVPFILIKNTAAENKNWNLNYWDMLITGLAR